MEPAALIAAPTRDWARGSIGRIGRRLERKAETKRRRRLLMVHLDGVPRQVLRRAIDEGLMPFLSRLVKTGAFQEDTAFWGSPASTPAFQAGVLYGIRHPNLPAYTWFEREQGRLIHMNFPREALSIEERVGRMSRSNLLEDGGTTYLSLFRANASNALAMTSLAELKGLMPALCCSFRGLRTVKRRSVTRVVRHVLRDTWEAGADALRWVRKIGDKRHEVQFMLNRVFLISLAWGLAWNRALIDMVRGVPAIYLVFGNYDEVSHRRGPFSAQAMAELIRADAALEELYAIGRMVEHPYDMVLMTDHGHVDSDPFEKRGGRKLEPFLLDVAPMALPADVERALRDGRELPVTLALPPEEPVVVESGNFSHVYLSRGAQPLEALELMARHRNVLARAVTSPDIGIVALRRGAGAVAIIGGGVYGPDELDRAPLAAEFSRAAVADLLRELPHMSTAGDLVLFGQAINHRGTVGFAWEFGSHGGLTKTETDSVILWPRDAGLDLRGLTHSTQLHERLSEAYRS